MSYRIAIVTEEANSWHGRQLVQALDKFGCTGQFVSLRECRFDLDQRQHGLYLPGFGYELPDGVFVRGVPAGTLEEIVFYLDVLHALRVLRIPVYNDARAIERTVDKCMTSFLLHRSGIQSPPTWVACHPAEEDSNTHRFDEFDDTELVFKPLFGSQGKGLRRIRKHEILPDAEECSGVHYLQRYIDCGQDNWHDWRVFIVGTHAVAAMRRNGNDWINNVATGSTVTPAVLEEEMKSLAEAAVKALDMNYAGVDLMRDQQGKLWVIEVNSIPAWKGLQSVSKQNIAELLVEDFLKQGRLCEHAEAAG